MNRTIRQTVLPVLAALIWGMAFSAQSIAADYIQPLTFNFYRCVIAFFSLWVVDLAASKATPGRKHMLQLNKRQWKRLLLGGGLCGVAIALGTNLQQLGLADTSPGKAGFITAMYIVLVPVFGLFLGRKCGLRIWVSVGLAVAGLYLLSCVGVTKVNMGDVLILISAAAFAVQILLIDILAQSIDGLRLNCIQFMVVTVLSALVAAFTEAPTWSGVIDCAVPLLYAGVLSSGAAFSLQILGQQHLPPEPASLIMSLESVFAVLAGWLILNQTLSPTELLGCCLVFTGVILCQVKGKE